MLPSLTPLLRFRLSLVAAGTGTAALVCLGVGSLLQSGGDESGGQIAFIATRWLAVFWGMTLTASTVMAAVNSSPSAAQR